MKKLSLLTLIIVLFSQFAISQTANGVMTKVPCNNDGIFTVTTSGMSTPITYTYYTNNNTIVHANVSSTTDQLTNIAMNNWGYVSCQVTDGISTAWAQGTYTPSMSFSISSTSPVCPATMGTVTATRTGGTTGPFSYLWTNKSTLITYTGNNASVPLGEYSVQITDNTTGCVLQITDSSTIVRQLSNVKGTVQTTKASCSNGTATVIPSGGTPPYTYTWSTGATSSSISGLSQGYYSLVITDAIGCKSTNLGAYITQDPYISVNTTVTDATCLQSDGSVLAFGSGGVPPYTYSWSNGQTGNNATNVPGQTSLRVIATDANGCTGTGFAYVNSTTPITVTYSSTPSSCTSPTGSATLAISGGTTPYNIIWYTNPTTSGTTISGVAPGTYSFKVTDNVGCVRTGTAVVDPISTISAIVQPSHVVCPNNNGTATANVTGSSPPFTYLWNNSATTSQITGLSAGVYSCTITDAMSCSVTKSAFVKEISPISIYLSTTPVSCKFNKDGAASAVVTGGAAPYTYSYTGGATTANATGLGMGHHWLTVTDANGCKKSKYFWIDNAKSTNSCFCTISGTVYLDANANCTYDVNENGIKNIMMHCTGFGYTFTDANGYYSFEVPTGTYTIRQQVNHYYPLASCQSNNITATVVAAANCVNNIDMANSMDTIHDLKLVTVNKYLPPVPGYNYQQKLIVTNMGTVTENNVQMEYLHDGQLPFASATLSSFTSASAPYAYHVQSGFPTLPPNSTGTILLTYNTPTNIPLSTNVRFYDTVATAAPVTTTWLQDYSPWNNLNTFQTAVVGSFDPNYKEVTPRGTGEEGLIPMSIIEFDYTIHFQNEGTHYARNISITDQLDPDLDWETFVPGYSEYDYTVRISDSGLVTFTFEEINLPWKSQFGDILSSGFVSYSIKRKTTLPEGTKITNSASIYFDFNEPIITNTTVNTLDIDNSISEYGPGVGGKVAPSMHLYPNPASDNFTIRFNNISQSGVATLNIIDLSGRVIRTKKLALQEGSTIVTQNISELAAGTYLTTVQLQNGNRITGKLFVQ